MPNKSIKTLDGKVYPIGYKVVTEDLKSLGLRKNLNIIEYNTGKWTFLPLDRIVQCSNDFGGIWVTKKLSDAKKLKLYMQEHYSKRTRIFKVLLDKILYSNSYRIKTNGVFFLEEIIE